MENVNILAGLNDRQKEAVMSTEGYVRVIASAGSGKTKTLAHRYGYLIDEVGVPSQNILCVTFTNKAANEMKKRIHSMIGVETTPYICTFHSFCVKVLREDIHTINYPSNFLIFDEDDSNRVLRTVYENMGITTKAMTYKEAALAIEGYKEKDSYVEYFMDLDNERLKKDIEAADESGELAERIFLRYIYEEKKNFALDFDDLVIVTLNILRRNADKREKWQKRLQYVMVDEFQDIDAHQYELVDILSSLHQNLFIVGDPDQNIYSWRGANVRFILDFDKKYKDSVTIILDENYRSTKNILDASNSLIEKNVDRIKKSMFTKEKKNIPVIYNSFNDGFDEAAYIISKIKEIKAKSGCEYNDFAILYRAHYVSRTLEEALLKQNIPYSIYSGVSFYQRAEIKDILCYLRMLLNKDDISFARTINNPRRGFGDKKIKLLKDYAEKNSCNLYQALLDNLDEASIKKSDAKEYVELITKYSETYQDYRVSDLVDEILKSTGYEEQLRTLGENDRLDNLAELKKSIFEAEQKEEIYLDLATYLQDISLYTNAEKSENKDSVKLMTAHSAKGLEWENVFVFELNEQIFPSPKCRTRDALEEERRLCYVAMTRARSRLFLTSSYGRNAYNDPCEPSRFVSDIDKSLLQFEKPIRENGYFRSPPSPAKTENKQFVKGDIVQHNIFGKGIIQEVDFAEQYYVVKFDGLQMLKNISFTAKLEKVENENQNSKNPFGFNFAKRFS